MAVRYGRKNCKHKWVYREDGWEEGCGPAICRKCGAFGCFCDVYRTDPIPSKKEFFGNKAKSSDNVGGKWKNPYIKNKKRKDN